MRAALAVLLLVLALASCGGGAAAPSSSGATASTTATAPDPAAERRAGLERETVLLEDLATRTCACADVACLETLDQELAAYMRVGTMNDVMTDEESWPPDLDARGIAAFKTQLTCMQAKQFVPRSLAIIPLRLVQGFRDASCACRDAPCIQRVIAKMTADLARYERVPLGDVEAEITAVALEMRRCAEVVVMPVLEQAVLELKAVRKAACACADATCAEAVRAEYDAYLVEYATLNGDEASAVKVAEIAAELLACLQTASSM